MTGWTGSAIPRRPAWALPRRSGCSPARGSLSCGIEDLAGNVWEWCGGLYDPADIKDPNAARVLRGGSWDDDQDFARSAYRIRYDPGDRYNDIGFRVVCSSPSSGTEH